DGTEFIATEYVEGETLRARLSRALFGVHEALDVAAQIADALVAAHHAGIVHRDIKPENVMIRRDGYVKVLDFGLAKLTENLAGLRPSEFEAPTIPAIRTNPGVVMGTAEYMSPEQARGLTVDARTDVWSLGVVVYEMLANRRPFGGETHGDTIVSILEREPVPLLRHAPEAPAELERIVTKALTKDREERYQTIKDMAIDLRRLRRRLEVEAEMARSTPSTSNVDEPGDTSSGGRRSASETDTQAAARMSEGGAGRSTSSVEYVVGEIKRHKQGAALLGAILILALGSVGYMLYRFLNQSKPAAVPFQRMKATRLTSNGKTKLAAVSPDGKFVAYVIDDEAQQSLWLKNVTAGSDVQILPPTEKNVGIYCVTFSPNGNFFYYGTRGTLYQLPILGGSPKKVLQNFGGGSQHNEITFSPDGKQFAFIRYSSDGEETAAVIVANADGTSERTLASSKRPNIFLHSATWSPDGKVIACAAMASATTMEIVTVRVADAVVSSIPSPRWGGIRQAVWRPDASGLLVIGAEGDSFLSQIWQLPYPSGEARNLTNDSNDYHSISLTADGRSIITVRAEQEAHLWVMSGEEAGQAKQLTSGFDKYDGIYAISWMPAGKIIYEANPSGKSEVWVIDADGRNSKQLATDIDSQSVSPDGNYLIFQSEDAEGVGLFRLNLGDGEKKRLTTGMDVNATFSPDGKWVVFTRYADQVALWKVSIEGGEAVKLTKVPGYPVTPAVSPDGKLIAFRWGTSGARKLPEIGIVPFEGGEIVKAFNASIGHSLGYGRAILQWTPDGQAINHIAHRDGVSNIWRQPIDGSPPVQVTNFRDGRIFNFAYSPDGKQLALSRGTFSRDVVLFSHSAED
ncbi:MAG: protein kinase, partial [Acidobacteriota bacterium]|nr:protein kinase [Acidobacteriota bacterium]